MFLEMLEAISNDIHMDHNMKWFILTTLRVIHVYSPVFQRKSEFCGFRNARGHLEGPGVPLEQHTQGLQKLYYTWIFDPLLLSRGPPGYMR